MEDLFRPSVSFFILLSFSQHESKPEPFRASLNVSCVTTTVVKLSVGVVKPSQSQMTLKRSSVASISFI